MHVYPFINSQLNNNNHYSTGPPPPPPPPSAGEPSHDMNHPTPPGRTTSDSDDHDQTSPIKFEWEFHVTAVVSSSGAGGHISDTIGVIEFNSSGNLFATGGIARKIRVYSLNSSPPLTNICTPAKLSSLKWKPYSAGKIIGSADYDGVVTEYDLETQMPVFERDEHSGRRIWSMDYSHFNPTVGASGGSDGTMQIWDPRHHDGKSIGAIQFGYPVCCVEFSPFHNNLIAVGCADRKAYIYDVRNIVTPVAIFGGHQRTVSYTRFVDDRTVVTSGTDGCLKMWDAEDQRLIRTYRGHVNERRFVGLSVWRSQGLIGCGSESNEVFVYDKRWGEPIWVHGFEAEGGFVSSICWSQVGDDECMLVGGGSDGVIKIFSGKRKVLLIN